MLNYFWVIQSESDEPRRMKGTYSNSHRNTLSTLTTLLGNRTNRNPNPFRSFGSILRMTFLTNVILSESKDQHDRFEKSFRLSSTKKYTPYENVYKAIL